MTKADEGKKPADEGKLTVQGEGTFGIANFKAALAVSGTVAVISSLIGALAFTIATMPNAPHGLILVVGVLCLALGGAMSWVMFKLVLSAKQEHVVTLEKRIEEISKEKTELHAMLLKHHKSSLPPPAGATAAAATPVLQLPPAILVPPEKGKKERAGPKKPK